MISPTKKDAASSPFAKKTEFLNAKKALANASAFFFLNLSIDYLIPNFFFIALDKASL